MPVSKPAARLRALVANATLRGDDAAVAQHKRDLTALVLEQHITRTLAAAPPLTAEQRVRLVNLLDQPASGGAA